MFSNAGALICFGMLQKVKRETGAIPVLSRNCNNGRLFHRATGDPSPGRRKRYPQSARKSCGLRIKALSQETCLYPLSVVTVYDLQAAVRIVAFFFACPDQSRLRRDGSFCCSFVIPMISDNSHGKLSLRVQDSRASLE